MSTKVIEKEKTYRLPKWFLDALWAKYQASAQIGDNQGDPNGVLVATVSSGSRTTHRAGGRRRAVIARH